MSRIKAFIMWLLYFILPIDWYLRLNGYNPKEVTRKVEEAIEDNFISDGYGNWCSKTCVKCGQKTMQVVRPGKFQCTECGD